jgi:hypothetical protein
MLKVVSKSGSRNAQGEFTAEGSGRKCSVPQIGTNTPHPLPKFAVFHRGFAGN